MRIGLKRTLFVFAINVIAVGALSGCANIPAFLQDPPPPAPIAWQPYYCYQTLGRISCQDAPQTENHAQLVSSNLQPTLIQRTMPYTTGINTAPNGTPNPPPPIALPSMMTTPTSANTINPPLFRAESDTVETHPLPDPVPPIAPVSLHPDSSVDPVP